MIFDFPPISMEVWNSMRITPMYECMAALEFRSGQTIIIWFDECERRCNKTQFLFFFVCECNKTVGGDMSLCKQVKYLRVCSLLIFIGRTLQFTQINKSKILFLCKYTLKYQQCVCVRVCGNV